MGARKDDLTMKRRIFALLLAVICVFTLASCKKDTAASLYADATKAIEEANGYEANINMKISTLRFKTK